MKCPHCQFENPADTRFCGNCAALLRPGPPPSTRETAGDDSPTLTAPRPLRRDRAGDRVRRPLPHPRRARPRRHGPGLQGPRHGRSARRSPSRSSCPTFGRDETMIERFRNELKLARRISHKNVCRMFDLGNCEGTYFITMEYVPGDDLKSIIRMIGAARPGPGRRASPGRSATAWPRPTGWASSTATSSRPTS